MSRIAGGDGFSLALKSNGSLWAWGLNDAGQLGLGDVTASVDSPTRVGVAHDWATIACGQDFSLALQKDGSLWAWGDNGFGQLGLGDTRQRDVPTRVPDWSP
jgi:alpha-tubulin suppressor-like RCC1 family protein